MEPQGVLYFLALAGAVVIPCVLLAFSAYHRALPWRTITALALPYGLMIWSVFVEPKMLEVRHVQIVDADWRAPKLRIGVIADTHVPGPVMTPERLQLVVARMNALRPDIILLLGDYVEGARPAAARGVAERSEVLRGIDAFSGLEAPLGVYAVLGNHDSWYDARAVRRALEKAGAVVLENEGRAVDWKGAPVWIAGLGDIEGIGADAPAALQAAPAGASQLVLAHRPDVFPGMPKSVALTFVGHTHCGQVSLPLFGQIVPASYASITYACGQYDSEGRKLYVSGGIGTSIVPVRFRAPPEIAVVTLSPAAPRPVLIAAPAPAAELASANPADLGLPAPASIIAAPLAPSSAAPTAPKIAAPSVAAPEKPKTTPKAAARKAAAPEKVAARIPLILPPPPFTAPQETPADAPFATRPQAVRKPPSARPPVVVERPAAPSGRDSGPPL